MLSDPDKRRKYDRYGEDGLKDQPQAGGGGIFDMFDFFGGGRPQERKGPDIKIKIRVNLADIYKGKEFQV